MSNRLYGCALKANLHEQGRFSALKKMIAASKVETEARISHVKTLSLIIMGTKDPDFPDPKAEAAWLQEHLHGELTLVENAGHYPHAEMPEQVGLRIIRFLNEQRDHLALVQKAGASN